MRTNNSIVFLLTSELEIYEDKFFEPLGPNNEILLEYNINNAIESGFNNMVFITQKSIRQKIARGIGAKFKSRVRIHWISTSPGKNRFSLLERIPSENFSYGTYALWKAKKYIDGQFLVINGLFYYGKELYREAISFMNSNRKMFAVLSSPLGATLSPFGGVDRSICITKGGSDCLKKIVDARKIRKQNQNHYIEHSAKSLLKLSEEILATTGVFCLNLNYFKIYREFLESDMRRTSQPDKKATITTLINLALRKKQCQVKAITVNSNWFSIKYKPERVLAISKIKEIVNTSQQTKIFA
ncbi:hypothetical protein [Flagellimonas sp. 2504JD4-2]